MMAEDVSETKDLIVSTLGRLHEELSGVLSNARKLVNESVEDFVAKKVGCLWSAVKHYCAAFERVDVGSRASLENVTRKHYRDEEVREAFDDLLQVEHEWDSFLQDIDKSMTDKSSSLDIIKIGQNGPNELELIDARSERKGDFDKVDTKVLVLSFGVLEGASVWLKETGCTFDMLLDPDRQVYSSVGLGRSVKKSWGIGPLVFYAETKTAGKPLPGIQQGVEDDPLQMGGDFIVDKHGKMTLMYCSKSSTDRPTVSDLLSHLKSLTDKSAQ